MELGIAVKNRQWLQQFTRNAVVENDWGTIPIFYRIKENWDLQPAISFLYYPPTWVWNSKIGFFLNPFRRDFPTPNITRGIWIYISSATTEELKKGFNIHIVPDRNIGKYVIDKSPDEPRLIGCKLTHILSETDMNYISSGEADNVLQIQQ